ncbi:hypothetical protein JW899_03225 [Candidatus Uhrbacteria bacterium]|nr:hypothetical protein [Candidatus Uhrbacteria bacterium]
MERPEKNPIVTVLKVAVPVVVMFGGFTSAWLASPKFRETVLNLPHRPAEQAAPETEESPETADPATLSAERDRMTYRDINVIRIGLAEYREKNGQYPNLLENLEPAFLKEVPTDPKNGGAPYGYRLTDYGYSLTFTLEGDLMGLTAGEHRLTPDGFDSPVPETAGTEGEETGTGENEPEPETKTATAVPEPEKAADTDGDGLSDEREIAIGTDPNRPDTDGDGLSDGDEVNTYGTNPLLADTDGDGFDDRSELDSGFDPRRPNERLADTDGDGLHDLIELGMGLNANLADTDGDGLADGDEVNTYGTNPLLADTDGDGHPDGTEISSGFNPLGDGLVTAEQAGIWESKKSEYGLHPPTNQTLEL